MGLSSNNPVLATAFYLRSGPRHLLPLKYWSTVVLSSYHWYWSLSVISSIWIPVVYDDSFTFLFMKVHHIRLLVGVITSDLNQNNGIWFSVFTTNHFSTVVYVFPLRFIPSLDTNVLFTYILPYLINICICPVKLCFILFSQQLCLHYYLLSFNSHVIGAFACGLFVTPTSCPLDKSGSMRCCS